MFLIIKSFFIIAGSLNQSILNHVAISRFDFPHLGTFMALISICAAFFFPPLCCSYSRRRQIGKQLIDKNVQATRACKHADAGLPGQAARFAGAPRTARFCQENPRSTPGRTFSHTSCFTYLKVVHMRLGVCSRERHCHL